MNLQTIAEFHSHAMAKTCYPSNLRITDLAQKENVCNFFPSLSNTKIFFTVDNAPKLPNLESPVIKHLTVLETLNHNDIKKFLDHLGKMSSHFLLLIESYNKAALELLLKIRFTETYYCQQKLLCFIDNLRIDTKKPPSNLLIRNFIPGVDEEKYAAFYNQALGFLGTLVDKSYARAITTRPSFDPKGYFIAEEKDEIVGFLSIEKEPWGEKGSEFGYIYQIGVADFLKGRGLAEMLLEKGRAFAMEHSLNRIGVGVRKSNKSAINFFKKHFFLPVYDVTGYLIDL